MKRILDQYSFSAMGWRLMGRSLLAENRVLHACRCFEAAIAVDAACAEAWYDLARCQEDLGLSSAANQSLLNALMMRPDFTPARSKLVRLLIAQGQREQALRVWWARRKADQQHSAF